MVPSFLYRAQVSFPEPLCPEKLLAPLAQWSGGCGLTPAGSAAFFSGHDIFSNGHSFFFREFLVKEYAQYWLTAWRTKPA